MKRKNIEKFSVELDYDTYEKVKSFSAERNIDVTDLMRMAVTSLLRCSKHYTLNSKISFGKFIGETLENVIRVDPDYVRWCLANIEGMTISIEAHDLLNDMLEEHT